MRKDASYIPYLPDEGLIKAVNLAIALERPLLLQGEPGCGKTLLARAIAYEFGQKYLNKKDEWALFSLEYYVSQSSTKWALCL